MKCTEVAVLRGGPSSEYEVSLKTGAGVIQALYDTPVSVRDITISRSGEWIVGGFVKSPAQALVGVDVVFNALHGAYGEDGTVQRIIDRLGIPYTGSRAYASAIAMNKLLTKDYLKQHNIKMPRHFKVSREGSADVRKVAETITDLFGPGYVVKPVTGGSSIDTRVVSGYSELVIALTDILSRADTVLVEERIIGREATVGVLEKFRNEQYYVLPAIEIIPPKDALFFDARVKYDGSTEEICPGRFSLDERQALQTLARTVHTELNLSHYSRSDFIVSPEGIYFLEVNTLPGLTAESLFPKAMDAVGASYKELVAHLIKLASGDV